MAIEIRRYEWSQLTPINTQEKGYGYAFINKKHKKESFYISFSKNGQPFQSGKMGRISSSLFHEKLMEVNRLKKHKIINAVFFEKEEI
jgi:hypothetical protein